MVKLICALPNPGCAGAPQGMFYPDTPEGEKRAEEFSKEHDRPGWGVFECPNLFHDNADDETFSRVLEQNGFNQG
jgi:hypothetical protein